nr:retrovirus-related Pol polyprotein from transposon TNT 1-94 [Tanacetum cinerariifolium]
MDLCGPMRTESLNKKKYIMVIVDDYTRFGWVRFLRTKDETPKVFEKFLKNVQLALNTIVRTVRIDNGTEFVNKTLTDLFEKECISHQTSVPSLGLAHNPQTPVQHSPGPKLKTLQLGRTRSALVKDTIIPSVPPTLPQLNELFQPFQRRIDDDEDFIPAQQVLILVNDAPAVQDPVVIPVQHSSTNVSAGAPAVTMNSLVNESSDVDTNANGFNIPFDHFDSALFEPYVAPDAVSEASSSNTVEPNEIPSTPLPHVQKWTKDHPLESIIGEAHALVSTWKQLQTDAMWCFFNEFITQVEPKNYKEALKHSCWIEAMPDELHEF